MRTKIAVVFLILVSTAFFAVAQTANQLNFAASFPFYVGGKLMPAGSYQIRTGSNLNELIVSSADGKQSSMIGVITRISASGEDRDSVVFDVVGNDHYLSEIYIQGEDGFMVKSTSERHTHTRVQSKK
jgi:hypothetical protein